MSIHYAAPSHNVVLPRHNYGIKVRLFLDNDGNKETEPVLQYLEEKCNFIIVRYTQGVEVSYKSHRKHIHLHIEVSSTDEWSQKTPIQQTFKNWQKSKGIPYAKSALSLKFEEKVEDYEKLLMYPLKCQETLEESSYHGISQSYAHDLWVQAIRIYKEKLLYINKKELKEETRSTTWKNLVTDLEDCLKTDPRWHIIIKQEEDLETEDLEYLGKIKNIKQACIILGPRIVDHYITHHDCDVPWNIDKLIYKFLLQKRLILSRDLYFILAK